MTYLQFKRRHLYIAQMRLLYIIYLICQTWQALAAAARSPYLEPECKFLGVDT